MMIIERNMTICPKLGKVLILGLFAFTIILMGTFNLEGVECRSIDNGKHFKNNIVSLRQLFEKKVMLNDGHIPIVNSVVYLLGDMYFGKKTKITMYTSMEVKSYQILMGLGETCEGIDDAVVLKKISHDKTGDMFHNHYSCVYAYGGEDHLVSVHNFTIRNEYFNFDCLNCGEKYLMVVNEHEMYVTPKFLLDDFDVDVELQLENGKITWYNHNNILSKDIIKRFRVDMHFNGTHLSTNDHAGLLVRTTMNIFNREEEITMCDLVEDEYVQVGRNTEVSMVPYSNDLSYQCLDRYSATTGRVVGVVRENMIDVFDGVQRLINRILHKIGTKIYTMVEIVLSKLEDFAEGLADFILSVIFKILEKSNKYLIKLLRMLMELLNVVSTFILGLVVELDSGYYVFELLILFLIISYYTNITFIILFLTIILITVGLKRRSMQILPILIEIFNSTYVVGDQLINGEL